MPVVETWERVAEYLKSKSVTADFSAFSDPSKVADIDDNWQPQVHGDSLIVTSAATPIRYGLAIEFTARKGGLMVEVRHQPGSIQELEAIHRGLPAGSKRELFSIKNLTSVVFDGFEGITFEGWEETILGRQLRDTTLLLKSGFYNESTRFQMTSYYLLRASS